MSFWNAGLVQHRNNANGDVFLMHSLWFVECSARTIVSKASSRTVMVSTGDGVSRILSTFFSSKMTNDDSSDEEDGAAAVHPTEMASVSEKGIQDWNLFGGRVNSYCTVWHLISLILPDLPTPNACLPCMHSRD